MKLFKKINLLMGMTAAFVTAACVITPTLITCSCCGFCVGMFVADIIYNWNRR